jgi:hypothetical protein
LDFGLVYTSEVFEDMPDIAPSLLARIRKHDGMDSKIRLSVYYSSNLTGGKEVLLSATTFSERELLRAVASQGVLVSEMSAEYCSGSRAYIQIVPYLSSLLDQTYLPIVAPSRGDQNPLCQHYVFYQEQDSLTPYLDATEFTVEPKFSATVPVLFLSALLEAMERSVMAWQRRHELERMRQGRFLSSGEALLFGWHVLQVNVRAARMGTSKVSYGVDRKPRASRTSNNSINLSLPLFTAHFPFGVDFFVETPQHLLFSAAENANTGSSGSGENNTANGNTPVRGIQSRMSRRPPAPLSRQTQVHSSNSIGKLLGGGGGAGNA